EFRPDKQQFFHVPSDYAAKFTATARNVCDALINVIVGASRELHPVKLYLRQTKAGFAHNRRRQGVKGGTPSPLDVLDRDVPILDVVGAEGNRKAIVFGYACHNTTIPPEDCRYCADWAGFAREQLQKENPGATALFITGCGADQNPEPRGSVELSQQYGREIAGAMAQSLSKPGVEITGNMRIAMEDVQLALEPMTRNKIEQMLAAENDKPQQTKGRFLMEQLDRGEPL